MVPATTALRFPIGFGVLWCRPGTRICFGKPVWWPALLGVTPQMFPKSVSFMRRRGYLVAARRRAARSLGFPRPRCDARLWAWRSAQFGVAMIPLRAPGLPADQPADH
jgi:hypothetical protein